MPDIDADLLLAHLEYSSWAVKRTTGFLDKLPPESLTCSVDNSFPTICADLMDMTNHPTHYLGQILTLARQSGYEPTMEDWTDLITHYVQRFPTEQLSAHVI